MMATPYFQGKTLTVYLPLHRFSTNKIKNRGMELHGDHLNIRRLLHICRESNDLNFMTALLNIAQTPHSHLGLTSFYPAQNSVTVCVCVCVCVEGAGVAEMRILEQEAFWNSFASSLRLQVAIS